MCVFLFYLLSTQPIQCRPEQQVEGHQGGRYPWSQGVLCPQEDRLHRLLERLVTLGHLINM